MKYFESTLSYFPYESKITSLYFQPDSMVSFDIETTGLYPKHDSLILSGLLTFDDGMITSRQYFADTLYDEKDVILATLDVLRRKKTILTFNGNRFDLPFLKIRAEKFGLGTEFQEALEGTTKLDLYQLVRHFSPLPDTLDSLKQKNIERFLGISDEREDMISGGESVSMYKEYLNTGSEDLEKLILLHNRDDIFQLARLLAVLKYCDLHQAMYRTGFPAGSFHVRKIQVKNTGLMVEAEAPGLTQDYISFPGIGSPCHIQGVASTKRMTFDFPIEKTPVGLVLDLAPYLPAACIQEKLSMLPGVESGYLVLKENGKIQYMAINRFLMEFLPGQEGVIR